MIAMSHVTMRWSYFVINRFQNSNIRQYRPGDVSQIMCYFCFESAVRLISSSRIFFIY